MPSRNLWLLFTLLLLNSCDEIGIPNIEDEEVVLLAPPDGHEAASQAFTFWWEEVEDADQYVLQIVSPDFQSPIDLVLDTLVSSEQFVFTLLEGDYEWRVQGKNTEFLTEATTRSLKVTGSASDDVSGSIINLQNPTSDICLTEEVVQFNWDALVNADNYLFQLSDDAFTSFIINQEVSSNSFVFNLSSDKNYQWRVRGENQTSLTFTTWAESSFMLDRVPPDVPLPTLPLSGDTIKIADQNPDLVWNFADDAAEDFLAIYADANQDTLLLQTGLTDNFFNLDDSSISFSLTQTEDYYWLVFSRDDCDNFSATSTLQTFYVQP